MECHAIRVQNRPGHIPTNGKLDIRPARTLLQGIHRRHRHLGRHRIGTMDEDKRGNGDVG